MKFKGVILPIIISALGLFIMSYIGYRLRTEEAFLLIISNFQVVNFTFTMQLYVLPLSFLGLAFVYVYNKKSFINFFRFSLSAADGQVLTWQMQGPILAIGITIGTTLLMSIDVIAGNGTINSTFFKLFPLVILLAATNAWTEEILSRFIIVAGLYHKLTPNAICSISAVLFGIPHFLGTPNGFFGVVISGILGWILAKSVIETKSMGWALLIHFLQDIVIFSAGAMMVSSST